MKIATVYRACAKECDTFRDSRPAYFSKFKCAASLLQNDLGGFSASDVHVVWDGPENHLKPFIKQFAPRSFLIIDAQNNCVSFDACLRLIDQMVDKYDAFFLTEDDHLYLPNSFNVLKEGLEAFHDDCVALGDHADRYKPENIDMPTRTDIKLTKSKHWRAAESYVCSFGFTSSLWRSLRERFYHHGIGDRAFFRELITLGRCLRTPMPAMSTHMVTGDLSPVVNWHAYSETIKL